MKKPTLFYAALLSVLVLFSARSVHSQSLTPGVNRFNYETDCPSGKYPFAGHTTFDQNTGLFVQAECVDPLGPLWCWNSTSGKYTFCAGGSSTNPLGSDAIIYLSTNGNDTHDGLSWGTAKLTLSGACSGLPGGNSSCSTSSGTIIVAKGTYATAANTTFTPGSDLTIAGAGLNQTIFTFSNSGSQDGFSTSGNRVVLSGFTINMGSTGTGNALHITGGGVESRYGIPGWPIETKNAGGNGVYLDPGSAGIQRWRLAIITHNNTGAGLYGNATTNMVSFATGIVDYCESYNNTGDGIKLQSLNTSTPIGPLVFIRPRVENNTGNGVNLITVTGVEFITLESEGNGGWGVQMDANTTAITFLHYDGAGGVSGTINNIGTNINVIGSPSTGVGITTNTIQNFSQGSGSTPLIIRRATGQTADLLQVQDTNSNVLFAIDSGARLAGRASQGALYIRPGAPNLTIVMPAESGQTAAIWAVTDPSNNSYLQVNSSGNTIAAKHLGFSGTAPAVSACGTTPSLGTGATDNAGIINTGSGTVTSCTLTFAAAFTNAPACVVSDNLTTITPDVSAISTTAVTFSFSATLTSGKIFYMCF